MRQIVKTMLIGFWAALPFTLNAGERSTGPVVIELFTSQGCSSCPPADAIIADFATRPDVLPLALHVDYWDYLGWQDEFARPEFTARQKSYARALGKRTVYTPQVVVQGRATSVGANPMRLTDAVRHELMGPEAPVTMSAERKGDKLRVTAIPRGALPEKMRLSMVRFVPRQRIEIERGENAGRVIDYVNIVTEWRPLAEWNGQGPLTVNVETPGQNPIAVILQSPGHGPILAASRVE